MSSTPAQTSASVAENYPFIDKRNAQELSITVDEDTRDSGATPTTQLRGGLVLGETSTEGVFIDAEDSAVVANVKSSVESLEDPDSDWASETITITIKETGATATVTLGGADDTVAEVVTALNADVAFRSLGVASNSSGKLNVEAMVQGVTINVTSSLATAFGASGVDSANQVMTKHVILIETIVSLLEFGSAVKKDAVAVLANAVVDESKLTGLTNEARQWFAANNIELR